MMLSSPVVFSNLLNWFLLFSRPWQYMVSWLGSQRMTPHPLLLDYQVAHQRTRDRATAVRRWVVTKACKEQNPLTQWQRTSGRSRVQKTYIWSGHRRPITEKRVARPRHTLQLPRHLLEHVSSSWVQAIGNLWLRIELCKKKVLKEPTTQPEGQLRF